MAINPVMVIANSPIAPSDRKPGRPKSGKKTYKVRLTPLSRKTAGKRGQQMGADFSAYVEALIRRDNPDVFPVSRILQ